MAIKNEYLSSEDNSCIMLVICSQCRVRRIGKVPHSRNKAEAAFSTLNPTMIRIGSGGG